MYYNYCKRYLPRIQSQEDLNYQHVHYCNNKKIIDTTNIGRILLNIKIGTYLTAVRAYTLHS